MIEIVKSLYIALRTTIIRRHMDSKKRSDSNQSKYWLRYSEHFNDESNDEGDDVDNDSEDAEIPSTVQDSSDESDDGRLFLMELVYDLIQSHLDQR